jgi:hypothetical protein
MPGAFPVPHDSHESVLMPHIELAGRPTVIGILFCDFTLSRLLLL